MLSLFVFISVLVPAVIYLALPKTLEVLSGKKAPSTLPLAVGGFLFFISWYLPSPLIHGDFTAFNTHFVGGGLFTGFLWIYIKNHLKLKLHPLYDLLALYALVNALGVANELWELALTELKIFKISPFDTWWDLFANNLGALTLWVLYYIYQKLKKQK